MNPIADTAWYCCGVRMDDANASPSLCNDRFAQRFMDEYGMAFYAPFRSETMPNLTNATRCRIVDDLLRAELERDPRACVVTVGAGFDTRPYRLAGGRWLELDEPQILRYKEARLPATECPNPLRRVEIRFGEESLRERLAGVAGFAGLADGGRVVVVVEGVLMYLERPAIEATLRELGEAFPAHVLVCDLMTQRFFRRFARRIHAKLAASGARFAAIADDPGAVVRERGYRETARMPMFRRALELGVLWPRARIPGPVGWLLSEVVLPDLNGYAVHRFERG